MAQGPTSLNIRTYNVGFGDCFLLSFAYGGSEKHVLIDYGSTGLPPGTPATRMMDIAGDIKARSGGKLTAVVATHRHKDHISGFNTSAGKGTGDVIATLKPDLVMQPWTEEPGLAKTATGPSDGSGAKVAALANMQAIAAHAAAAAKKMPKSHGAKAQLQFIGDDNIANPLAVKNLATMGKNEYLYCGAKSGLGALLPGVTVNVLGPPTVKQTDTIKKERARDPNQFWQFQSNAMAAVSPAAGKTAALFPRHVRSRGPNFPVETRWFIYHAAAAKDDQTLQIVRMLDDAMNNTSIILLLQIGAKTLLFPGDAQIENWQYALGQDKYKALLANVDLYKVGHHGSLNATPKTLWALFKKRSPDKTSARRMASLMSTMPGKHGSVAAHTEVPRQTLHDALDHDTTLFTTESLKGKTFFEDTAIKF